MPPEPSSKKGTKSGTGRATGGSIGGSTSSQTAGAPEIDYDPGTGERVDLTQLREKARKIGGRVQERRDLRERRARLQETPPKPEPPIPTPAEVPEYQLKKSERDFTPPPGSTVLERSAKGEPTVYEKSGERYYTPASTMWDLGFRTSSQYHKAQVGEPVPYVVVDVEGKKLHITRAEAIALSKLDSESQFTELVSLGIISEGSQYVPGKGKKWSYIPASEVKRVKSEAQAIAKAQARRDIVTAVKQKQYQAALDAMEGYKTRPTMGIGGDTYDVAAAIRDNVPDRYLKILFSSKALSGAKLEVEEQRRAEADIGQRRIGDESVNFLRKKLKLTPSEISKARDAYFTASEKIELKPGRGFKLSDIWKTPDVKLTPEQQARADAWFALDKKLRNLPLKEQYIELARFQTTAGATALGTATASFLPILRRKLKQQGQDLSTPLKQAVESVGMLAIGGTVTALLWTGQMVNILARTPFIPNKGQYLKEVGKGIGDFVVSVPPMVAAEPFMATAELVGVFVVGPGGALRFARQTGVRTSPHYIPKRGIAIEYSVARVPIKRMSQTAVTAAVNKAIKKAMADPQGKATVRIGGGQLNLKIRSTPVSEVVGPALYHATPEISAALLKGKVKGALYTSPQAAPRFADSSAAGIPTAKPAILMIYSKGKGVKWHPTHVLYKGTKEIEAIFPAGTQLTRVKTFRSRLLGAKAGDFITAHNGKIIPIYRFAEKGAKVPQFGLAELAAIRIKTIQATIADLVKGKRGWEIVRAESLKDITRRIIKEAEKEVKKGTRYDKAIDTVMRRELTRLYRKNPRLLERMYRARSEMFEGEYLRTLGRELESLRHVPPRERLYRVPDRRQPEIRRTPGVPVEERAITEGRRRVRRITTEERARAEEARAFEERAVGEERVDARQVALPKEKPLPKKKKPVRSIRSASDREKRRYITSADGAIAFRMGELQGRDVWHVVISPYRQGDYFTLYGKRPIGATIVRGPSSAVKTAQTLYGKTISKPLRLDIGATDALLEPISGRKGIRLSFTPDPLQKTTGDITIGRTRKTFPLPK